jgi:hypothetical protein
MTNIQDYFEIFDFNQLIEKLFTSLNIQSDDNHLSRHMAEVRKKIDEFKKNAKTKGYFNDMPILNTDFSSYIICINVLIKVTNTPFVERDKQEKFKLFINKKLIMNFQDKVRDIIFPYSDSDKDRLANSAFILLKFDSYEEAKLAANGL